MFRDDFESELDRLQQLCDELATREPALAPLLGRHADAPTTRLVEGAAFAFARLRQRLDDELPELVHPVLESLCPDLLRPVPSTTVMELRPTAKVMTRLTIPAGTEFGTAKRDGRAYSVRTMAPCEVVPWRMAIVTLSGARTSLRLRLELHAGAEISSVLPRQLPLYFAQGAVESLEALDFVLRHCRRVTAHVGPHATSLPLPAALLAAPRSVGDSFLALRDHFVSPRSFAFVTLGGLDALTVGGERALEIELTFDREVPAGVHFDTSSLLLHCVVAADLFRPPPMTAPLLDGGRRAVLRFDSALEGSQVHSLESVSLVSRGLQTLRVLPWADLFDPRADAPDAVRYEVHRTASVVGAGFDVSLTFEGPSALLADKVVAEVDLVATHGARSGSVGAGEIVEPTATSPALVEFRNVTPATRGASTMLGGERAWQLLGMLKYNLATVTELETLRALLAVANVPARAGFPQAMPDPHRFVPLLAVERSPERRSIDEQIRRGARVTVQIDRRYFSGLGQLRAFGSLLAGWFAAFVDLDEWVQLTVIDAQRELVADYPPRFGSRHVL